MWCCFFAPFLRGFFVEGGAGGRFCIPVSRLGRDGDGNGDSRKEGGGVTIEIELVFNPMSMYGIDKI